MKRRVIFYTVLMVEAVVTGGFSLAQGPDSTAVNAFIKDELGNGVFRYDQADLALTPPFSGQYNPKENLPPALKQFADENPWENIGYYVGKNDGTEDFVSRVNAGNRDRVSDWVHVDHAAYGQSRKTFVRFSNVSTGSYVQEYTTCASVPVNAAEGTIEENHYNCRSYNATYCDALIGKDASLKARMKTLENCSKVLDEVTRPDQASSSRTAQMAAIERINAFTSRTERGAGEHPIPQAAYGEEVNQTRMARNAYQEMKKFVVDLGFCAKNRNMFPPKGAVEPKLVKPSGSHNARG